MFKQRCSEILQSKIITAILVIKILTLVFFQAQYASDVPVTSFYDSDGATALATANRTQLTNDNRWFAYGPVYYRVTRALAIITNNVGISNESIRQEHLYFLLILTSFLCCLGSFYLIFRRTRPSLLSFNLSLIVFSLFLMATTPDIFLLYLLFPHPDFALTFFLMAAAFFIHKWMEGQGEKFLYWSFAMLGVATSTKISAVYFCIGFGAAFLLSFGKLNDRAHWLKFFKCVLAVFVAYFLVGFPQNFRVMKTIDFLIYQNQFHLKPSLGSFVGWISLLVQNSWIIFSIIIFMNERSEKNWKFYTWSFLVSFFLFALTVHTAQPSQYYIIPCCFLFWMLASTVSLPLVIRSFAPVVGIGLIIVGLFLPYPKIFPDFISTKQDCRSDIKRTMTFIKENSPNYNEVLFDAYTPKPLGSRDRGVWGLLTSSFEMNKTLFVFSWRFSNVFFREPDAYTGKINPKWTEHRELYGHFKNGRPFHLQNLNFKQLLTNKCGIEVWEATR